MKWLFQTIFNIQHEVIGHKVPVEMLEYILRDMIIIPLKVQITAQSSSFFYKLVSTTQTYSMLHTP